MSTGDWILMVSMYIVLGPWIVALFYVLGKWGPEVKNERAVVLDPATAVGTRLPDMKDV